MLLISLFLQVEHENLQKFLVMETEKFLEGTNALTFYSS